MSKKILTLDNVPVINKKIGKIDTIEKLKASTIYSIGDVVEVLGFHTKGDGAHHKRIARAEDDGSGEQGQNGIWWCIVHSGEVNVSWFGAKGDGVTDDTAPIQKAIYYNSTTTWGHYNSKNIAIKLKGKHIITDSIILTNSTTILGNVQGTGHSSMPHEAIGDCFIAKNMKDKDVMYSDSIKYSGEHVKPTHLDAGAIFDRQEVWTSLNITLKDFSIITLEASNDRVGDYKTSPNWAINLQGSNGSTIERVKTMGTRFGISVCGSWHTNVLDCRIIFYFLGYYSKGCTNGTVQNLYSGGVFSPNTVYDFDYFLSAPIEFTKEYGPEVGDPTNHQTHHPWGRHSCSIAVIGSQHFVNCIAENSFNGVCLQTHTWKPSFVNTYIELVENAYNSVGSCSVTTGQIISCNNLIQTNLPENISTFTSSANGSDFSYLTKFDKITNKVVLIGYNALPFDLANLTNVNYIGIDTKLNRIRNVPFYKKTSTDVGGFTSCADSVSDRPLDLPFVSLDCDAGHFLNSQRAGSFRITVSRNEMFFKSEETGWKKLQVVTIANQLDTPYYTLKMQQEGIYENYVAYRDELHEYENSQVGDETMLLPVLHEPEIPDSVKAFAEKYKLI